MTGSAAVILLGAIALLGGLAAGIVAAIAVVFARKVVIPVGPREEDLGIGRVDLAGGELELYGDEAGLAGRYGLWFERDSGHARLGAVVARETRMARRRIEGVDFGRLDRARRGRLDGWYYLGPWEFGHGYENVVVQTPLGPAPAWYIPSAEPGGRWVIQVHGRGAKRGETLRALPAAYARGWDTLVVSYRNDGEAPASVDRRYGLGGTEWEDVVAAVRFAREHGAEEIVLMGWSMGGTITLQAVLRSEEVRERLVGVILESPAIDWVDILRFQGTLYGLPEQVSSMVTRLISAPLAVTVTGIAAPIDLHSLDAVARAEEFDVPILLLASEDDGFVPIDGARRFAAARPDLVQFEVFTGARHVKLWNHDPERWTRVIEGWLARRAVDGAIVHDEDQIAG
ncbi:alpha/beta hydrolase family protein [Agromyces aerolatus]|uniref:alpha/beta hydrolase family protein n=1 Tax=Agromyces sp. LY-1074 TaxID=3074080 RepID=UPI0028644CE3|nr:MULTISPECIES: alpha/beta fold hydrolase [unclassified Agromyces]MDR5700416.1 alpha/beta fold hydrolase [Agromyces sp. LY-1074]MDR5706606.1 alpha/beta fold hydrolase [Agromyces sp. LY-1358]